MSEAQVYEKMITQKSKGQISLEFVTATLFFIILLVGIIFVGADYVPEIEESNERASINLESRRMTAMILSSPGYHSVGSGGTDWAQNSSTVNSVEEFGLATEYHRVEREKVMALNTIGEDSFNYSQFRDVMDVENQYRFEFTVLPVIDTSTQYLRTNPPKDPAIVEPNNTYYSTSGNDVGYGSLRIDGIQYNFLTTSHDSFYDTLYVENQTGNGWNFSESTRYRQGDDLNLGGEEYAIRSFQNRGDDTGTVVILSRQLKSFGSSFDVEATVEKMNRYAVIEGDGYDPQPLSIEVFSWV